MPVFGDKGGAELETAWAIFPIKITSIPSQGNHPAKKKEQMI